MAAICEILAAADYLLHQRRIKIGWNFLILIFEILEALDRLSRKARFSMIKNEQELDAKQAYFKSMLVQFGFAKQLIANPEEVNYYFF